MPGCRSIGRCISSGQPRRAVAQVAFCPYRPARPRPSCLRFPSLSLPNPCSPISTTVHFAQLAMGVDRGIGNPAAAGPSHSTRHCPSLLPVALSVEWKGPGERDGRTDGRPTALHPGGPNGSLNEAGRLSLDTARLDCQIDRVHPHELPSAGTGTGPATNRPPRKVRTLGT
jgi:hypothetical protein